jgi:ZIP family zinc transporter
MWPTVFGFATGAVVYVGANYALDAINARNRRGASEDPGTGTGIAIGALLDGVPESMVLGLSMVAGNGVSIPVLVAVLISNIPEGLSSTAELKSFVLWGSIALASALSSLAGYTILADASGEVAGFITALAAGAILAMVTDTMIPDAYRTQHNLTGLFATVGFLLSFVLSELV